MSDVCLREEDIVLVTPGLTQSEEWMQCNLQNLVAEFLPGYKHSFSNFLTDKGPSAGFTMYMKNGKVFEITVKEIKESEKPWIDIKFYPEYKVRTLLLSNGKEIEGRISMDTKNWRVHNENFNPDIDWHDITNNGWRDLLDSEVPTHFLPEVL